MNAKECSNYHTIALISHVSKTKVREPRTAAAAAAAKSLQSCAAAAAAKSLQHVRLCATP